jgi:hypothetical protein
MRRLPGELPAPQVDGNLIGDMSKRDTGGGSSGRKTVSRTLSEESNDCWQQHQAEFPLAEAVTFCGVRLTDWDRITDADRTDIKGKRHADV